MVVFNICNKCSPLEKSHPFSYGICCRWLPHHLEEGAGSVNDFRSPGGWVNVSPLHASSKHWSHLEPINLQGASRDTHLHPRVTLVRQTSAPLHHGSLYYGRFYDGLSAPSVAVGTFVVATLCNPWRLIRFRIASFIHFIQKKCGFWKSIYFPC